MKLFRSIRTFSVLAAISAILLIAAPAHSWNGDNNRGDGIGYYNHHQQYNGYGHRDNYGYDHGRNDNRRGSWDRRHGGYHYPYYRPYHRPYYHHSYYEPSISFGFPFCFPGFSFYVGL